MKKITTAEFKARMKEGRAERIKKFEEDLWKALDVVFGYDIRASIRRDEVKKKLGIWSDAIFP